MISQNWAQSSLDCELGKRGIFSGKGIVLEGEHQLCLPFGIGFTGEFVLLAVKFLALELEEHHVFYVIDDG